jgi:uncharacterized cupin superfamily protein
MGGLMIEFQKYGDLTAIELPAPKPKPTSISGDQVETEVVLWKSDDGLIEVGVWECSPGRFSTAREDNSEICHIIAGSATLRGPENVARDVGPGDLLVLPLGWRGEWTIHASIRKLYMVQFHK